MNAPTNIQILKDAKGKPAFAVIPYSEYLTLSKQGAKEPVRKSTREKIAKRWG